MQLLTRIIQPLGKLCFRILSEILRRWAGTEVTFVPHIVHELVEPVLVPRSRRTAIAGLPAVRQHFGNGATAGTSRGLNLLSGFRDRLLFGQSFLVLLLILLGLLGHLLELCRIRLDGLTKKRANIGFSQPPFLQVLLIDLVPLLRAFQQFVGDFARGASAGLHTENGSDGTQGLLKFFFSILAGE